MKFRTTVPLFLLLILVSLSCHKEDYRSDPMGVPVTVTFAGRVLDDIGAPLAGATVEAGASSAVTDAEGVFYLAPVTLPSRNAILKVKHAGFFDFSRAFMVEDKGLQQVTIRLMNRELSLSFEATKGATAQSGDALINFKANSVATAVGSAYTGTVYVYTHYLDPGDDKMNERMPGDLRGITTSGETQVLTTFGMVGVELSTPGGDPLQLAAGYDAEITMPIPGDKQAIAPAEIPLWYYDVEKARWIEEGKAQKTGNAYTGNVQHFTFWNFDTGVPAIHLSGRIFLGDNQHALGNALVKLTALSGGYTGFATTDAEGYFAAAIPQGEALQLGIHVYGACGNNPIYTQTVGPFGQDATLPAITISGPNLHVLTLSGRLLNCDQQPVTLGYVRASNPEGSQWIFAALDGTFEYPLLLCNTNGGLTVTGFDLTAGQQSAAQTFPDVSADIQTGDIPVCVNTDEYATVVFNGNTYNFSAPFNTGYSDAFITSIGHPGDPGFLISFSGFEKTGNLILQYLSVSENGEPVLTTHNGLANITHYGPKGDYISGAFNGTAQAANGQTYPVSCEFQVIRDY